MSKLIVFIVPDPLVCRYCREPLLPADAVVTRSYWQAAYFLCHQECRMAGEKEEALLCQTVDADCNDCRHFRRDVIGKHVHHGHCLKFDQPTEARPHMSTGKPCFEHRRA